MSQQINLFDPALAPRVERLSARLTLRAMVVVAVFAFAAAVLAQVERGRIAGLAAQRDAQLAALQGDVTRMAREAAGRKPDPAILAELESTQALAEGRRQVMARLQRGDLGDTGGVSEYLRAFARQRLDGIWLTGLSIGGAGREITVRGRTMDAQLLPEYLGRLRAEAALRGRAFATLAVDTPARATDDEASAAPAYLEFRLATTEGSDAQPPTSSGTSR
ncbi:MAG: hypothetical protein IT532_03315 [Burkholderiales bacterium]|nr:hypothetical protein [Burkholderiales bacterium]